MALPSPQHLPVGIFEVQWIGPIWFQRLAKLGLGLFGFKNWYGKEFLEKGEAVNLFRQFGDDLLIRKYPMKTTISPSVIDRKDCMLVSYPKNTRFPWPHIIDEFRYSDQNTLFGQSYAKFFPFFPLPFFLRQKE